ncbi:hypothetical protein BBB57_11710 [Kosakonia sacchari]|uniref:hypothetical protein n=1 Tax=Kosakonia sacchari TaxID=1158459 RepID=UPI000807529E|nr:hypothetical protein [Kosakonia sacchari]ANR81074.1 hypothetical protein BBB57_11710 [Kosakonia sacchari]
MTDYWWKDLRDRNESWQGLELMVREGDGQAMEMLSGHNGRMALQVNGQTLFWATMLNDHSGVWLVFNADHPAQQLLLPAISSGDVESAKRAGDANWISYWCRYFARQLMEAPTPLLAPRRWLLRPMEQVKPTAPYVLNKPLPFEQWRFHTPASSAQISVNWSLWSEDFPDLQNPEKVTFVDWWWNGHLLLARYPVDPASGRVKWWRKKCREGELPPILVWFIAGLASFVILDGHDRLQAALAEGLQPQFLVLSELTERSYTPDEETRERVLRSLALQQEKCKKTGANIDAMNQSLLNLYDTRYLYAPTHSRAVLGDGKGWERDVTNYLQRHQLEGYLDKILAREE